MFIVVVCLAALVVLSSRISGGTPTIAGYQVKAVLSGSMEPAFQTGSIIAIQLKDKHSSYEKGDVITFQMEGKLITHRITDVKKQNGQTVYKTKGDNNDGVDRWTVTQQNIIGMYKGFTIPYVGYALNYSSSKVGSALLLFIPGLLLLISAIRSINGAKQELEAGKVG
nr:signal peptidase I [Bacillus sp. 7884-1]